ncbi:MAG TPA: hypothetical protein VG276_11540 [Actinomycetes bacterium]|nr:hypothetical protein [Actinomycetes bacterium]
MADDTREAVAIRVDRVQIVTDRNSTLWGLRLLNVEGVLALVRTDDGLFVVFVENGDRDVWEVPLEKVRYLGDPPPPFGIKALAGTAVRVDIDGDRKIIVFTGLPSGNATEALADKEAREAWVQLLPEAGT